MSRMLFKWLCLVLCFSGAGCQRGDTHLVPVNGVILMHGMPARASITAQVLNADGQPNGRPSTAETRPDGSFTLLHTEQQAGALIGPHTITVTIFPHERAEGEFDFNQRFRPLKVARFTRLVESGRDNHWKFFLTL